MVYLCYVFKLINQIQYLTLLHITHSETISPSESKSILTHFGLVTPYDAEIAVKIFSGNTYLLDSTNTLPGPMLVYHQ